MDNNLQRRSKFVEIANKRVNNALKSISLIGNLSNQSSYSYTKDDVTKIIKALTIEIDNVRRKFESKGNDETAFQIE